MQSTVGACALLLALLPAAAMAETAAHGWQGEVMPEGLSRSENEGEYLWARDNSVMVFVPGGRFEMGSSEGRADERPVRQVWLDAFYIDKYEVSWSQWKASGLSFSEYPGSRMPHPDAPDWGIIDEHPVVNVDWEHAQTYARWAGKQLPSEAQWEKAARGSDGRRYPWGNEPPTFERAVWREHPVGAESTAPVDCCEEGASPYGALNMAGNVFEWCLDSYEAKAYQELADRNPVAPPTGPYRVLRGGALVHNVEDLRSALRYRLYPADRTSYIGFRTALPATADDAPPAADKPAARGGE